MNCKDEQLVLNCGERLRDERNEKKYATMAKHLANALGTAANIGGTVERALLDIHADLRDIKEELRVLTGRVDVVEDNCRQLFQVVDRRPQTQTNQNIVMTSLGSQGTVEL